jgi:hypothetical protein
MTKFLANWEVESDITLPPGIPFIRYDHPAGTYTVFLRNIAGKRGDLTFLSMQFIFDAPAIQESKDIGERLAKEFLDHLAFVSNLKVRLRRLFQIFNWEPGSSGMRESYYYSDSYAHDDAPYEELRQDLLDTIKQLQNQSLNPRLRRALKWFANGVAAGFPDDQFAFFWFVIELVAQLIKESSPVPDKCPVCQGPLHCAACEMTPLHRPYPKQAIEQLFMKYVTDHPVPFYKQASDARNMLMHGEDVAAIEAKLEIEFSDLVNALGQLAWTAILNQFVPVLMGKQMRFLQTSRYVHFNMSGVAQMQVGFIPNFNDPDPGHFPNVQMTMKTFPRTLDAEADPH